MVAVRILSVVHGRRQRDIRFKKTYLLLYCTEQGGDQLTMAGNWNAVLRALLLPAPLPLSPSSAHKCSFTSQAISKIVRLWLRVLNSYHSFHHKPEEKASIFLRSTGRKFQRELWPGFSHVPICHPVTEARGMKDWLARPGHLGPLRSWGMGFVGSQRQGKRHHVLWNRLAPCSRHTSTVFIHWSQCSPKSLLKCQ